MNRLQRLEWLGAAEDLAVEDSVPGVGVRRPAAPSVGDPAQLLLCSEAFGDRLARDRGIGHAIAIRSRGDRACRSLVFSVRRLAHPDVRTMSQRATSSRPVEDAETFAINVSGRRTEFR